MHNCEKSIPPRYSFLFALVLLLIGLALPQAQLVAAAGQVGNGSAASCTEAALTAALQSGGTVTFNCGSGNVTIPISGVKEIALATTIDGGGKITLDGQGKARIFYLNKYNKVPGMLVALRNLTLTRGTAVGLDEGYGGCVYNRMATVELLNVTFSDCAARRGAGFFSYGGNVNAIGSTFIANEAAYGSGLYAQNGANVNVSGGRFSDNVAAADGAGIYAFDGPLLVEGTTFSNNNAAGTEPKSNAGLGGAVYLLQDGALSRIQNSTFTGNTAKEGGGGIFVDNSSYLALENSTFTGNSSGNMGGAIGVWKSSSLITGTVFRENDANVGGAIHNGTDSRMTLQASSFSGNQSLGDGGALYNYYGTLTASDLSFTDNVAGANALGDTRGGAIVDFHGTVVIERSTFARNSIIGSGSFGGAIASIGKLTVSQSTFSTNSAQYGGAIYSKESPSAISFSTLSGNTASSSGASLYAETNGPITLKSSLVVGGSNKDCRYAVTDGGGNLQGKDTTCLPKQAVQDLLLGVLGDHGGSTQTIIPASGSPAIDASAACVAVDQRGVARPYGAACDAGSVEVVQQLWLEPSVAFAAGGELLLRVHGERFSDSQVVLWNGSARETTLLNSSTLQARILASDLKSAGSAQIRVDGSNLPQVTLRIVTLADRVTLPIVRH